MSPSTRRAIPVLLPAVLLTLAALATASAPPAGPAAPKPDPKGAPSTTAPSTTAPSTTAPSTTAPKAAPGLVAKPDAKPDAKPAPKTAPAPAPVPVPGADPKPVVEAVLKAHGGRDKLLRLFRMTDDVAISSDPEAKGRPRVAIVEPPGHWWQGKRDRVVDDKEPAVLLVWVWTGGALADPATKVEVLPDGKDGDAEVIGLRLSESIKPPMDVWYGKADHRLVRIDWRGSRHRFSNWKEHDGAAYAARCVGSYIKDDKVWYSSRILELQRVTERPAPAAK